MKILFIVIISYLIGSFPSGYLMGKFLKGIDIRQYGSKNVGATNVFRVVGKMPGLITLLIDIIKGLIVIVIVRKIMNLPNVQLLQILAGLSVIIGHNWTIFLGFKGGKGVATSTGVFFGLVPESLLVALLLFSAILLITRKVSLGSLIAVFVFPFVVYFFKEPREILLFSSLISFIVIVKHIPNINRLIKGTENKITDQGGVHLNV